MVFAQELVLYLVSAMLGIMAGLGIRAALTKISYSEAAMIVTVWVLLIIYVRFALTIPPIWDMATSLWMTTLSYVICAIGLPLFVPQMSKTIRARLADPASQWLLTVCLAALTYSVLVFAQMLADIGIRYLLQTNPEQFPGAQRVVTAVSAFAIWFLCVYLILFVLTVFGGIAGKFSQVTGAIVGFFVLTIMLPTFLGKVALYPLPLVFEELVVRSSFVTNVMALSAKRGANDEFIPTSRPICANQPNDSLIAFPSHDEVAPGVVMIAEPRIEASQDRGFRYRYRTVISENTNDPQNLRPGKIEQRG